jgi:hypothetical protein
MAFRKFPAKKASEWVQVGFLFKETDPKFVPKGASKKFSTTVKGEYLDKVVDAVNKAAQSGSLKISVVQWPDKEHPAMSIAAGSPVAGKKISGPKKDEGLMEDAGL